MKTWIALFALACLAVAGGCAMISPAPRPGVAQISPDQVRMYDSLSSLQGNYALVSRIRTEQANDIARTASSEEGIATLKAKAASLGANCLMNALCVQDPKPYFFKTLFYCSANAILVK